MMFPYGVGPLLASSCFPYKNSRRRHSSGGSSLPSVWPRHRRARLVPHLSLCTGWKWPQLTEVPSFFPSCTCLCTGHCGACAHGSIRVDTVSEGACFPLSPPSFLGPSSLHRHIMWKSVWKPVSWTRISLWWFSGSLRSNRISVTFGGEKKELGFLYGCHFRNKQKTPQCFNVSVPQMHKNIPLKWTNDLLRGR